MIKTIVAVSFGGAAGSVLRFLLLSCMQPICASFPYDILFINIIGSFLIGLLPTLCINLFALNPTLYATIITGLLGGFTTFSSFSLSVVALLKQGALISALFYIFASVFVSLCATYIAIIIAQ